MTSDGHTALSAILTHDGLFPRVKDKDLIAAAIKLASKQVTAAGLTSDDLLALKTALGADVFEKTLESLSPYHIKLLARRLDKDAPEIEVNTASSALSYVRQILSDGTPPAATEPPVETPPSTPAKKNKYLGRKAFRTGR